MAESQTIRVSVEEAARLLDIEKGSVKKPIQRGKLRSEKDARGTTFVYVDRSGTARDESQGRSATASNELVDELRDRVRFLEDQLGQERDANRENRRIIAALTSRIPELEAQSEPRESPKTAANEAGRAQPRPASGGAQEPSESVSWWRRWFGGG